jgi:hypothetical protein
MQSRVMICAACCLISLLASCRGTPEESVIEVKNGAFKIVVRSQEFHHSGTVIVDVCVVNTSSREFPKNKGQCLLHGDDFSGLTVKWQTEREIEISFACGRVSYFRNYVLVYRSNSVPEEFHAILHDRCESPLKDAPRQ